jgi:hypothetical protein
MTAVVTVYTVHAPDSARVIDITTDAQAAQDQSEMGRRVFAETAEVQA